MVASRRSGIPSSPRGSSVGPSTIAVLSPSVSMTGPKVEWEREAMGCCRDSHRRLCQKCGRAAMCQMRLQPTCARPAAPPSHIPAQFRGTQGCTLVADADAVGRTHRRVASAKLCQARSEGDPRLETAATTVRRVCGRHSPSSSAMAAAADVPALRWGVMGCANIAKKNVKAIKAAAGNTLVVRSAGRPHAASAGATARRARLTLVGH